MLAKGNKIFPSSIYVSSLFLLTCIGGAVVRREDEVVVPGDVVLDAPAALRVVLRVVRDGHAAAVHGARGALAVLVEAGEGGQLGVFAELFVKQT